jgi:methionine-S-sulfoxide reductase
VKTEVGYTQGSKKNPKYEKVCCGVTGHAEAVQVTFDTTAIKYEDLLVIFWESIDPTALNKQGNDTGTQYRTGIYYSNENQKAAALRSKDIVQKKIGQSVVTEILKATTFYPAEEYHQQYLEKGGQCARTGDLTPIRCYG